jgi:hypothetical protein
MIEIIMKVAMCFLVLIMIGTGFMYASFFRLRYLCTPAFLHLR